MARDDTIKKRLPNYFNNLFVYNEFDL